jgi:hypothetical protein
MYVETTNKQKQKTRLSNKFGLTVFRGGIEHLLESVGFTS